MKAVVERLMSEQTKRDLDRYKHLLALDITSLAKDHLRTKGSFYWTDMCSGVFRAGLGLEVELLQEGMRGDINLVGVDILAGETPTLLGLYTSLVKADAVVYQPPAAPDLVTCLKGLYLIDLYQHEALEALFGWYTHLAKGGTLAFTPFIMGADQKLPEEQIREYLGIIPITHQRIWYKGESSKPIHILKS